MVYPEEITERNLEQLLDSLSNSDVLLYIADKDNLDSTERASKEDIVHGIVPRFNAYSSD